MRRHVTAYLNVPVYRAYQEWLGRGAELGPMWQAWERGDRKAAVAAVPASVMDDLILRGSMAEIRAHVQRYLDAGIDTAFLQVSTLEQEPVRRRQILLDALRALAPVDLTGLRGSRWIGAIAPRIFDVKAELLGHNRSTPAWHAIVGGLLADVEGITQWVTDESTSEIPAEARACQAQGASTATASSAEAD